MIDPQITYRGMDHSAAMDAKIVASLKEHEDPYVAMHEAFQVLYRQLEEDIRRKRGQTKRHQDERGDTSAR